MTSSALDKIEHERRRRGVSKARLGQAAFGDARRWTALTRPGREESAKLSDVERAAEALGLKLFALPLQTPESELFSCFWCGRPTVRRRRDQISCGDRTCANMAQRLTGGD